MVYKSRVLEISPWKVHIDLVNDANKIICSRLEKLGFKNIDYQKSILQFFKAQKRMIEPKPRKVIESKEIVIPVGYEDAYKNFIEAAKKGRNLNVFTTNQVMDLGKNDDLLNDWNIHHFHLTKRFDSDGRALRNKYLIFAYVKSDKIYLI